jgi:hypothetical protein
MTDSSAIPIALIIVCRNALPALLQTVASVKALADARILPIIIDGSSTDGTPEWLATARSWTFHARSEPDTGIYEAMNKGWAAAPESAYILFLGAGDLLYELPADALLRDSWGHAWALVLGDTRVGDAPFRSRWCNELRLRNTAHHQAMLVHKSVSRHPPFDERLKVYADWDFNLRLFRTGLRARYVPGLRTSAEPEGASWSMEMNEIHFVAKRHGGTFVGAAAWALNSISRWRRRRRDARRHFIPPAPGTGR